jgi:hypothetical protein
MNAYRWLQENDLGAMLDHVYDISRQRKLRLWLAACLRWAIELRNDALAGRLLQTVDLMERHADGRVSDVVLAASRASLTEDVPILMALRTAQTIPLTRRDLDDTLIGLRQAGYPEVRVPGQERLAEGVYASIIRTMNDALCAYLRDLFGNPFDPVNFHPHWRTPDVRLMAEVLYREPDAEQMPVLADALLDAGCDDDRILNHCREGIHLRGCWLLDAILERH